MQNERSFSVAGRKLFFALPAYDHKLSLKLTTSLMQVAQEAASYGVSIQVGSICGCSVVSRARNLLVRDFMDSDATDLMFIDSDINFEPSAVFRLLAMASAPTHGIVAGVPRTRETKPTFITNIDHGPNGEVTLDGMGLIRAEDVATAFMMVKREVFSTLIDENPQWNYFDSRYGKHVSAVFDFMVTPEGYVGEDFLFCRRARAAGFGVWIDPTITLGHMGIQEYIGNYGDDVFYPSVKRAEQQDG